VTDTARLIDVDVPDRPRGVVLVLHGGASRRSSMRVSPAQLSVLRMVPIASAVARAGRGRLAVHRLLNSRRGWDTEHTPLADVDWALREVAERHGPAVPVCLVGHSLGGRAALLAAGRGPVHGVVALAPWVYASDTAAGVHDTPVVIIHGDQDRIADPERAERVGRAMAAATPVSFVSVRGGTHSMLRHHRTFDGLAARCAVWMLLGETQPGIVERIAAGERWLEA
jgi:predicted esterase